MPRQNKSCSSTPDTASANILTRPIEYDEILKQNQEARLNNLNYFDQELSLAFFSAFEFCPYLLLLTDSNYHPKAANKLFRKRFGFELNDLERLGWSGILHPDNNEPHPVGSPHRPAVRKFISANETLIYGQVRVGTIGEINSQNCLHLVIIEDISSNWENAERQRVKSLAFDILPIPALSVAMDGTIIVANDAALACFHWSANNLIGAHLGRVLELSPQFKFDQPNLISTDAKTWHDQRFPVRVNFTPLPDKSGVCVTVTDLTAEQQRELRDLRAAQASALGEMASSIAHEFNQCLHVIRLASEAIKFDADENRLDTTRIIKRTGNVLTQVDHLADMVGRMRQLGRNHAQSLAPFPLVRTLEMAIRLFHLENPNCKVNLEVDRAAADVTLTGSSNRLAQTILHLLTNSLEAINRAHGNPALGQILLTLGLAEDQLVLTLTDNGDGIDAAIAQNLFDPFVTTKPAGQSCGLGLSLARSAIGDFGGLISLDTTKQPNQGACFKLVFPKPGNVTPTHQQRLTSLDNVAEEEGDDDDLDLTEKRLLIVDDEALSVMMLSEFLSRHGYKIDIAYDGVEAVKLAENNIYWAVITDIRMPRMDGIELIRKLDSLQPGTPVLVVTGHLKENAASSLGKNVCGILPKPFQLTVLRERLAALDVTENV